MKSKLLCAVAMTFFGSQICFAQVASKNSSKFAVAKKALAPAAAKAELSNAPGSGMAGVNALSQADETSEASVIYFPRDQVEEAFAKGSALLERGGRNYMIIASRREKAGTAEFHERDTDIFYVTEGSATFVTGGSLVDAKVAGPNEISAPSIQGGVSHQISKGDVIVIPKNTPHWFKSVQGPLTYFIVKVR